MARVDAPARSTQLDRDIQGARNEFTAVSTTLDALNARFSAIVRLLEDDNAALRQRLLALDSPQHALALARLAHENADLRRALLAAQAERTAAERARDAALAKLQNMRTVMEDLLSEHRASLGAHSHHDPIDDREPALRPLAGSTRVPAPQSSTAAPSSTASSRRTSAASIFPMPSTSTSTSTSASAFAPDHPPPPAAPRLGPAFSPARKPKPAPAPGPRTALLTALLTAPAPPAPLFELSPGSSDSGMSVRYNPDGSPAPASGPAKWRIHFVKPPPSAKVLEGPIAFARLEGMLELDHETKRAVYNMQTSPTDTPRLHLAGGYAFLRDPIFLECPSATYIVDWTRPVHNHNHNSDHDPNSDLDPDPDRDAHLARALSAADALHTLVYSSRKQGWYYLGRQHWAPVDVRPVWPMLAPKAQRALAARRARGSAPADVSRMLARGALVQRAVELRLAGAGALAAGLLGRIREVTMATVRGSVGGGDADDAGDVGDVDL